MRGVTKARCEKETKGCQIKNEKESNVKPEGGIWMKGDR